MNNGELGRQVNHGAVSDAREAGGQDAQVGTGGILHEANVAQFLEGLSSGSIVVRSESEVFPAIVELEGLASEIDPAPDRSGQTPEAAFIRGVLDAVHKFTDITTVTGTAGSRQGFVVLASNLELAKSWESYLEDKRLEREGMIRHNWEAQGRLVGEAWGFNKRRFLARLMPDGTLRRIKISSRPR